MFLEFFGGFVPEGCPFNLKKKFSSNQDIDKIGNNFVILVMNERWLWWDEYFACLWELFGDIHQKIEHRIVLPYRFSEHAWLWLAKMEILFAWHKPKKIVKMKNLFFSESLSLFLPVHGMGDTVCKTNTLLDFPLRIGNNLGTGQSLWDHRYSLGTFDGLNQPCYHEVHGI